MAETRVLIGRIDNQLVYQVRSEAGTPLRNEVVYNGNVIGEMPLTWSGGTYRSPTPAPTVQWQQPQNIAAARTQMAAINQQAALRPQLPTGAMIIPSKQLAQVTKGGAVPTGAYANMYTQTQTGQFARVGDLYKVTTPAPVLKTASLPVSSGCPVVAAKTCGGVVSGPAQPAFDISAVKPPVGSPFSEYQVVEGYWFGKTAGGVLERLNPVALVGGGTSVPDERYMAAPTRSTPVLLPYPEKPAYGSTQKELKAWAESTASIARANALATGQIPESEPLLASKLFEAAHVEATLYSPVNRNVITGGGGGGSSSGSGGAAAPTGPTGMGAILQSQLSTMGGSPIVSMLTGGGWGGSSGGGGGGGSRASTPSVGSILAGLPGVSSLMKWSPLGATAAENNQGVDLSGVQPVPQQQSLFSKQYQPSEVTIPFTNVSVYPAYEALHGAGEWFTKNVTERVGSGTIVTPFNVPSAIISMLPIKNETIRNVAQTQNQFVEGMFLKAPVATAEFIGMIPVGAAILAKEPAVFPAAAVAGLKMQAQGIKEGITTRPAKFIGEQAGIALLTYGLGEGIKTVSPIKYTGKVPYGTKNEVVNYRGVYAESPVASVGKLFGRGLEAEGTKNLFGITTEPASSGFLKNVKPTIGTPVELARKPYLSEGFVPRAGSSVVDVPLVREFLAREGVKGTSINKAPSPKHWVTEMDLPFELPESLIDVDKQVGKEGTFYHATNDPTFIRKIVDEGGFTVKSPEASAYPQRGMFFGPKDTVYAQFLDDDIIQVDPKTWAMDTPTGIMYKTDAGTAFVPKPRSVGSPPLATQPSEMGGLLRLTTTPTRLTSQAEGVLNRFSRGGLDLDLPLGATERAYSVLPKNKLYPGQGGWSEFVVPEGSRLYYLGESKITRVELPPITDPYAIWYGDWGKIERIPVVDVSFTPPRPSGLELFDTSFRRLSELQRAKPTTVRNPYTNIERVSVIKPGTGKQFLDLVKEVAPEHKFTGTTEQVMFQRNYPAAHDIDILVPKKDIPHVQEGMARKYFAPEYGSSNVRYKGTGIEVFKEGNWQTAMDIHDIESHSGMLGFGVKTGVPVEVEGVKFIPLREQLQRKVISEMALRETPEGWTIGPALHRGKEIADTLGALKDQMISYEMKGRAPPERLMKTYQEIKQSIAPGSPLDQIFNPRTGKSVAQEARLRLKSYQVDYTPTDYTGIPFMNKYYDFGKFTPFEKKYVNPTFEKFGIGFGTRIVDPGAIMEYPVAVRALTGSKAFAYPSASAGVASRVPTAVLSLGPQPKSLIYPTSNPKPSATTGWGGYPTTGVYPSALAQFGYTRDVTSPQRYITSQVTQQKRSPLANLYTSTTPTQYFKSTPPETLRSIVPYLSEPTRPSRPPVVVTYPGRTPTGNPGTYITTTTKTPKYPPGLPPEKPPKRGYPPTTPPGTPPATPPGYPPLIPPPPPEKPPMYPPGKPPSTPPGYPPSKPPKYPPGLPPEKPPTYPPTIPPFPPTTPPTPPPTIPPYPPETPPTILTPPKQFLIVEEWPPKTPKLRLHFDVIGSKWNIRNPIPRLGTGAYPKIELKIEDKVYSRDPMRYVEHRPYDKFVSWRSGSSWNVKNPVPRITAGGKYPKRELQVSNVNKGRFVSMTPAAVSKKGKVSVI